MGSVPNCQKEILTHYAIRWFKCKLKLPKKVMLLDWLHMTHTLKSNCLSHSIYYLKTGFLGVTRVFPKLTDLTFLAFLYKIDITGFQNQQKKIASTGY